MTNLYVFAIGGSGERVMKSLIMLLAAGMKINADHIIPVFIDNDVNSAALSKCMQLLDYYRSTPQENNKMGAHSNWMELSNSSDDWGTFFKADICKPIILNKSGNAIGSLKNIIGNIDNLGTHSSEASEELNLLFSDDDLNMPLNVGFVGNPNIGSIVLNSLSLQDNEFTNIVSSISCNDGIFVIGSLFGGTGAAGMPLVVNTFNSLDPVKRPSIGTGAVLPYYNFPPGDQANLIDSNKWDVDSDTFETKTRAALMYYDVYMRDVDYMYYIGDDLRDAYGHFNGGMLQNNPTHLVEILTALSIIDFSKCKRTGSPVYKRPVISVNTTDNSFNIQGFHNDDFKRSIVKFQLLKLMFENDNFLKWALDQKKTYVQNIHFDMAKLKSIRGNCDDFQNAYGLNKFFKVWDLWIKELSSPVTNRKFSLFNLAKESDDSNVLENFYSNSEHGIALTREEKEHWYSSKTITKVVPAEISESLEKAFDNLDPKNFKVDDDRKILAVLLRTISDALDEVLNNKCITL